MRIHFVGIGGIGASALAKYYLEKGNKVSGSDLVPSDITESLKKQGVKIFIGPHSARCLTSDVEQVIYTPAVKSDNPELKKAKKLKIKRRTYPEAMGELTKKYFTIAVSGTHGKSTTTTMIGLLLKKAGLDPTVIVGTKVKEFNDSNCRVGKSKYLVIEADEWQASFLNYWPKIIILTNIEREHLDYYKNLKNILKTFKKYITHLPENGMLVANKDDKNIIKITQQKFVNSTFPTAVGNVLYYSREQKEARKLKKILKIPGEHNISNAMAALTVARALKIPDKISYKALSEYKGSWRRFEITKTLYPKPCTLISDYAHHPTEIKATLQAVKEKFPSRKIWCVFQPHQYQRTFYLFNDFVRVFQQIPIDKLIITDIYDVAGRENKLIKKKVSSKKLVEAINKARAIYPHTKRTHTSPLGVKDASVRYGVGVYLKKEEVIKYLKKNLQGGETLIIMGAGDIYKLALPSFALQNLGGQVDSFNLTAKKQKRKIKEGFPRSRDRNLF